MEESGTTLSTISDYKGTYIEPETETAADLLQYQELINFKLDFDKLIAGSIKNVRNRIRKNEEKCEQQVLLHDTYKKYKYTFSCFINNQTVL